MAPEKLANRTLMLKQLANIETHLKEGSPLLQRKSTSPRPNDKTTTPINLSSVDLNSCPVRSENNNVIPPSSHPSKSPTPINNNGYTGGCPFSQGIVK